MTDDDIFERILRNILNPRPPLAFVAASLVIIAGCVVIVICTAQGARIHPFEVYIWMAVLVTWVIFANIQMRSARKWQQIAGFWEARDKERV